jgi:hypothetical protein
VFVDTTNAPDNFTPSCGPPGSGEIVLQWTPDSSGTATVDTCSANFDTVIYARQTDCAGGADIACNDDACGFGGSSISFSVVSGETYFIFIDGFSFNNTGQATANFTIGP